MGLSTRYSRRLPIAALVAFTAWQVSSSRWPRTWSGPVRIGFAESPPYSERGPAGEYTGAMVDVLEEAARRAGIKLEWVDAPDGADKSLASGQVDLWPMAAIMDERKKRFHLSEGWIQTYYCLLSRADHGGEPGSLTWRQCEPGPWPGNSCLERNCSRRRIATM